MSTYSSNCNLQKNIASVKENLNSLSESIKRLTYQLFTIRTILFQEIKVMKCEGLETKKMKLALTILDYLCDMELDIDSDLIQDILADADLLQDIKRMKKD